MPLFLASLVTMTVLWSPGIRLERTRVCLQTRAWGDREQWMAWCAEQVREGAGMIILTGPDEHMPDELASARQASRRALVGAAEPCGEVSADVIHMQSVGHSYRWFGKVTGCQVGSVEQAHAASAAGCSYVVVDAREKDLVEQMAADKLAMVWFVDGCETMEDLEEAARLGARRVWTQSEEMVGPYSACLRRMWRGRAEFQGVLR